MQSSLTDKQHSRSFVVQSGLFVSAAEHLALFYMENNKNQDYLEQLNHTQHELRTYCRKSPILAILGLIAVV